MLPNPKPPDVLVLELALLLLPKRPPPVLVAVFEEPNGEEFAPRLELELKPKPPMPPVEDDLPNMIVSNGGRLVD